MLNMLKGYQQSTGNELAPSPCTHYEIIAIHCGFFFKLINSYLTVFVLFILAITFGSLSMWSDLWVPSSWRNVRLQVNRNFKCMNIMPPWYNLKIVNRQSFKHDKSCFSFDSGTAVNTILNSINYPFLTFSSLAALFQNGIPTWLPHWPTWRNTVDILQIGIAIQKHGTHVL